MPKVTTKAELEAEVRRRINKSLEKDIAPLIKQEIQKSVDEVVYAAGEPTYYIRRREDGGLQDLYNMSTEFEDCKVSVRNDTEAVGYDFDPLAEKIEYGYGSRNEWYNRSRPFMDAAQENVNRRSAEIQQIIQRAVNKGN